jgi:transposase-like protein
MSRGLPPWHPPFCPNNACRHHHFPKDWRYKRIGSYARRVAPSRIQRFLCCHCRRSFSTQTFSTTYWLRRPDLQRALFMRSLGCSAYRQMAREFQVAPSTVERQLQRLGRHCLLFQQRFRPATRRLAATEPLVLDGFESFEFSQYHPCHFHLLVGQRSHFFHAFTDSELRRKGRMTERQKRRRQWLERHFGRPDPGSIRKEVAALLRLGLPPATPATLHTDDHPAYPRALAQIPTYPLAHRVTPGRERRTPDNPLFPVNLLDLLLRHSGAHLKRETIAFSKRRQSAAERLAVFQVWRNFVKSFSERKRDATPAMRLGVLERPLGVAEILEKRLFPSQGPLPARLARYYWRTVPTRRIPNGRSHQRRYAV